MFPNKAARLSTPLNRRGRWNQASTTRNETVFASVKILTLSVQAKDAISETVDHSATSGKSLVKASLGDGPDLDTPSPPRYGRQTNGGCLERHVEGLKNISRHGSWLGERNRMWACGTKGGPEGFRSRALWRGIHRCIVMVEDKHDCMSEILQFAWVDVFYYVRYVCLTIYVLYYWTNCVW